MFENVEMAPADPILGLNSAFQQDDNPNKVNLGVGVFKDEQGQTPVHEEYLWGNSATLVTCLIADAFTRQGWAFNPNQQSRVGGLPVHHYQDEYGDSVMKPCAEISLNTRGAEVIRELGLIPIYSVRNEDSVQIGQVCTVMGESIIA